MRISNIREEYNAIEEGFSNKSITVNEFI